MKTFLFILSVTLGVANPVFALEAGERHADPYKVMTKGQVIGQIQSGSSDSLVSWFLVAYQGELYRCGMASDGSTLVLYSNRRLINPCATLSSPYRLS